MKLEATIHLETPRSRETIERQLHRSVGHAELDADEVAGTVGLSSRCRICLRFARKSDGESDRARIESLDVKVELDDARDVQTVVEWSLDLATVIGAPLRTPDGRMLDSEGVATLLHASRRAERRFRALLAVIGVLAMVAGGACLYGFDYHNPLRFDEPGSISHARLIKPGMMSCVVGVVLLTIAVVGGRASKPLRGSSRRRS